MNEIIDFGFKEIDLNKTTSKGGDGLEVGPTYMVLYDGNFHIGTFHMQHYGLNFNGIYPAGAQYDPPGINYSSWQKIWVFANALNISDKLELKHAELRKKHAAKHGMTSHGRKITLDTPVAAFYYCRNKDKCEHEYGPEIEDSDGDIFKECKLCWEIIEVDD